MQPPRQARHPPELQQTFPPSAITHSSVTQTVPLASEPLFIRYASGHRPVFLLNPIHVPLPLRSPRVIAAISIGVVAAVGVASYALTRRKPSAEEIERERRDLLARAGRITDGTIMDTMIDAMITESREPDPSPSDSNPFQPTPSDSGQFETTPSPDSSRPTPNIIIYNYRIAGVTYECAQDVTMLAEYVHNIRTDLPIQFRYAPHNPANSIVVAETWSGLRLNPSRPYPARSSRA